MAAAMENATVYSQARAGEFIGEPISQPCPGGLESRDPKRPLSLSSSDLAFEAGG